MTLLRDHASAIFTIISVCDSLLFVGKVARSDDWEGNGIQQAGGNKRMYVC